MQDVLSQPTAVHLQITANSHVLRNLISHVLVYAHLVCCNLTITCTIQDLHDSQPDAPLASTTNLHQRRLDNSLQNHAFNSLLGPLHTAQATQLRQRCYQVGLLHTVTSNTTSTALLVKEFMFHAFPRENTHFSTHQAPIRWALLSCYRKLNSDPCTHVQCDK
jgi:hypothetical protein